MITEQEAYKLMKDIQTEVGYGKFKRVAEQVLRDRLGAQVEKRKPLPKGMKEKLYVKQSGICPRCENHFSIHKMTDDHTVPIAHGGTNQKWNRRLVCRRCNSSKGDNTPLEESKLTGQTVTQQLGGQPNV